MGAAAEDLGVVMAVDSGEEGLVAVGSVVVGSVAAVTGHECVIVNAYFRRVAR